MSYMANEWLLFLFDIYWRVRLAPSKILPAENELQMLKLQSLWYTFIKNHETFITWNVSLEFRDWVNNYPHIASAAKRLTSSYLLSAFTLEIYNGGFWHIGEQPGDSRADIDIKRSSRTNFSFWQTRGTVTSSLGTAQIPRFKTLLEDST